MASRSDLVSEQLATLGQNLSDLWVALTTDPRKKKRRERAWTILAGALTVGGTMLARRGTARLWSLLTGEPPPVGAPSGKPGSTPAATAPRSEPSERVPSSHARA